MSEMNTNPDTTQTTTDQTDDHDHDHEPRFQLPTLPGPDRNRRADGRRLIKFGFRRIVLALFVGYLAVSVTPMYTEIGFLHPMNANLIMFAVGIWTLYKVASGVGKSVRGAYMFDYPPIETAASIYFDWATDLAAPKVAEARDVVSQKLADRRDDEDKQTLGRRATSGGTDSTELPATIPKGEKPAADTTENDDREDRR